MTPVLRVSHSPFGNPLPNIHTPPLAEALVDTLLGLGHTFAASHPSPQTSGQGPMDGNTFFAGQTVELVS